MLFNTTNPLAETLTRDVQEAARALGLQFHILHASTERDLDTAFPALAQLQAGALVVGNNGLFIYRPGQLGAAAKKQDFGTVPLAALE